MLEQMFWVGLVFCGFFLCVERKWIEQVYQQQQQQKMCRKCADLVNGNGLNTHSIGVINWCQGIVFFIHLIKQSAIFII